MLVSTRDKTAERFESRRNSRPRTNLKFKTTYNCVCAYFSPTMWSFPLSFFIRKPQTDWRETTTKDSGMAANCNRSVFFDRQQPKMCVWLATFGEKLAANCERDNLPFNCIQSPFCFPKWVTLITGNGFFKVQLFFVHEHVLDERLKNGWVALNHTLFSENDSENSEKINKHERWPWTWSNSITTKWWTKRREEVSIGKSVQHWNESERKGEQNHINRMAIVVKLNFILNKCYMYENVCVSVWVAKIVKRE